MKSRFLVLALLGVLSTTAMAQNPRRERRNAYGSLSMEEQTRLRSAHDAALRDPQLMAARMRFEQARAAFRDQLRAGMVRVDPQVQPILEKVHKPQREKH